MDSLKFVDVGVMYKPCTGKAVTTALQHGRGTCDVIGRREGKQAGIA
jgi:hypothetical protein